MADSTPTFNIFGPATKDDIKVGYISTDRGFISGVSICEANDYAKLNPGTVFIFRDRQKIRYIDINQVNKLDTTDLLKQVGDDCSGIQIDKKCEGNTNIEVFGGAGLGVLANPIIGVDGSVLAVDVVQGGFGYEYTPKALVKDPCGIGAGAALRVEMVTGKETPELVEYTDEEDFENYEICNKNNVGFGRRYSVGGKDIGEWNPNLYLDEGALSFEEQLKKYTDFLLKAPNPWWTTRSQPPLRVTSGGNVTRAKYDVNHWAWGSVPNPDGMGTIIGDIYLEFFGRRPDAGGFAFWQKKLDSGSSVDEIRKEIMTMPEYELVQREGRFALNSDVWLGGAFYKADLNNFMNSYAISPVPMSNVIPSDFGGNEHYFEWDIDFPHSGDYIFKLQCDNQGKLFIDGEFIEEYKIGSGGAAGNVLSPPASTKVGITTGIHTVRVDIFNGKVMKKVAEQQKLEDLATSNKVNFKFSTNTMYANTLNIDGLDVSLEKKFGDASTQVREDFSRDVEYGRVYDVKITSNNIRTGTLPETNKALVIDGDGNLPGHSRLSSSKRIEFDDNAKSDGSSFDVNATFTIDKGNATFAADCKSIKGTGEQTITLWWNDARKSGRAINSIKLGTTIWTRTGKEGSVTRVLTLGGGIGQLGGENNLAHLRTKGSKVIEMEDIPGVDEAVTYDDVVLSVDQGRFYDINGLNCKYTLGDRPAATGTTSTEKSGNVKTIFNTAEYIDKANIPLWRTNIVTSKDSGFVNRYGISPFDTSIKYESSKVGTHEIQWRSVNFPVSGEYDIGIGVDDNVRLRIGSDVDIYKEGFSIRGDASTYTGTSLYRRFITAGTYTIIAELEQVDGGKLGYKNIAGEDAGGNPMTLAINIETAYTEKDVQKGQSWNQNPMGVALAIEAPDPPVPQEPAPIQEGRCPPNPFWSTRFPNADEQWYPVSDQRQVYRYGMSPVKPYGEDDSSGGGQTFSNTWKIDAPYSGFYKLKAGADDTAVIKLDGNEVLKTTGVSIGTTEMVFIEEGDHDVTVEISNVAQETFDSIDKRVFTTQGWSAIGTQVEQALNTNDVDFKFSTNTMYANTLEIPGLDVSLEKKFGDASTQVREDFSKKVEFGKVYDVKITTNNIRTGTLPETNKALVIDGDGAKQGHSRLTSPKRIEYDDNAKSDGSSFDVNATFTIDSGNATFAPDGKSIVGTGEQTITLWWNDARKSGRAINSIKIGTAEWRRTGKEGSVTHKTVLGGGEGVIGGANNLAVLRTKGENVIQMEDIPDIGEAVTYDDLVLSASQGRFYDINGLNCKYILEKETKTVMQGGIGSGTVKDGVVYNGPELFHKNFSGWGAFMNKASVCQNPTVANTQTVNYSWSNVDFPESGEYQVKFQNDAHGSLYLNDREIVRGSFDTEAGVSDQDKSNWSGEGKYKKVNIEKGKYTLTVAPSGRLGLTDVNADTLFKQPAGYKWHENPSGFAIEIRKKMQVVRTGADGKPVRKPWKENPVLVSAHLIPPPCPRLVEGKGQVKTIIPIVPGNSYTPPPSGGGDPTYEVELELTNVLIEDAGINYDPEDKVVITGGGGDPVVPPLPPKLGLWGEIIDIPVPPRVGIGTTSPDRDPPGYPGFTRWPDISITSSTGIGFKGIPVFQIRRTPPLVDPDRLLQVTDLVGLKQTGYYDGKPYYGAIFYKEGIKYAGWYETAGQLVQVYDTLQESIDAMVTTPPSAIQRQGSDIRSNDPRLNIPGTPDNLTY